LNKAFTRIEKEMKESYFSALKLTGVSGVIMPYDKIFAANILNAKKHGFSVWIVINATVPIKATTIDYSTSGVLFNDADFESFSFDALKNTYEELSEYYIDGFILQYPKVYSILWDDSFRTEYYREFSNYIEDYLVDLFEENGRKSFRSWYYNKCSCFIYDKFVAPAVDWADINNVNLCFDIGAEQSQYYYFLKHISLLDLLEKNISLCVTHSINEIVEVCVLLSKYQNNHFVISEEYDKRLQDLCLNVVGTISDEESEVLTSSDRVLLIRCDRGILENYTQADESLYFVNECDSLVSSIESTYYCDMLHEKGFNFEITNEKYFEKYIVYENNVLRYKDKEISQILICNSCIFSEKMCNFLDELKKDGVCINNTKLIDILGFNLI